MRKIIRYNNGNNSGFRNRNETRPPYRPRKEIIYRSPANLARYQARQKLRSTGELKGMDTDISAIGAFLATTNTNGDCICLNLVQQGAGSWNRVGRKIHSKSVRFSGAFSLTMSEVATSTFSPVGRVVLVWDKQPSGAALPTFDAVFGTTDQTGTEASNVLAPPRYDNMDRFRVLRDWRLDELGQGVVTNAATSISTVCSYSFDEYVKLPDLETVFSGQTNPMTIADLSSGALLLYFRQTSATLGGSWSCDAFSFARLRYRD